MLRRALFWALTVCKCPYHRDTYRLSLTSVSLASKSNVGLGLD